MGGDAYFGAEAKQAALEQIEFVSERLSQDLEVQFDNTVKPLETYFNKVDFPDS